ncbi:MAG: signal peptidase I [Opitutales bacterium]
MGFLEDYGRRRRQRKTAKALLKMVRRIVLYRGDVLTEAQLRRLDGDAARLREEIARRPHPDFQATESAIMELHRTMVGVGGRIYPVSAGTDLVDMVVMAAIVAGGIRSFVFQPFKIPTNSMWPTYHGMTSEVRLPGEPVPDPATRLFNFLQWTSTVVIPAESDGEVFIPLTSYRTPAGVEYAIGSKGSHPNSGLLGTGLFGGRDDTYQLLVGDRLHQVVVPGDFGFEAVLLRTYFPREAALTPRRQDQDRWQAVFERASREGLVVSGPHGPALRTGVRVRKGDPILNFDILTGDFLFVDRISYHFRNPVRGDTFVFQTGGIPGLADGLGRPSQSYYVKRIAGAPGDRIKVDAKGRLHVNGVVATTPEPVALNNRRETKQGYFGFLPSCGGYQYAIPLDREHTVSRGAYFALGDNSSNSFDSRGWGEVPARDVVGPPLIILHPISPRWGLAK